MLLPSCMHSYKVYSHTNIHITRFCTQTKTQKQAAQRFHFSSSSSIQVQQQCFLLWLQWKKITYLNCKMYNIPNSYAFLTFLCYSVYQTPLPPFFVNSLDSTRKDTIERNWHYLMHHVFFSVKLCLAQSLSDRRNNTSDFSFFFFNTSSHITAFCKFSHRFM